MSHKQSQTPSSSAHSNLSRLDLTTQARDAFGTAEVRPQDDDPGMLRFLRRANLNKTAPFPENYLQSLREWVAGFPVVAPRTMGPFTEGRVLFQDAGEKDAAIVGLLKPPPPPHTSVLSVDFAVHNEISFDGYICVGSVSSPTTTLVVDTLFANREFSRSWMTKMLTGKRVLKVFLGLNDVSYRLRKDWGVFVNGAVDLQSMFQQWKKESIHDVYKQCAPAVKNRLLSRGKVATEDACMQYLKNLQDPTLEFFIETLYPDERRTTSEVENLADYRRRPLHPDLVQNAAMKSYIILKTFFSIYSKIGHEGLQSASIDSIGKLTNTSSLPRSRCNLTSNPEIQWVIEMILRWRTYLAQNLDFRQDQILSNRHLSELAHNVYRNPAITVEEIANLLQCYEVPDKFHQSAKLLLAYLDRSGQTLAKMRNVICRSCNQSGHVAKFCYMEKNSQLHKEYTNRRENFGEKLRQYQRRRENYCRNRGFDPATYTCPWESEPGVPLRMHQM